jgi:hypothetical protein
MDEIIFINGKRAQLTERSVSRNLQVNDFGEIAKRQSNYSNTIKLPFSPINKEIFDFVGVIGNTSEKAYRIVSIDYSLDSIQLVNNGKGILKKTSKNYELVFYDGNITLRDLLGNSELKDLDFTSINHTLTINEFFQSSNNTGDYIYLLKEGNTVDIHKTPPFFYAFTVFQMIFEQKGWTIAGDLITNAKFKKELQSVQKGFENGSSGSVVQEYSQNHTDTRSYAGTVFQSQTFNLDSFTLTTGNLHSVSIIGTIQVQEAERVKISIFRNGNEITSEEYFSPYANNTEVNIVTQGIYNSGDVITTSMTVDSADIPGSVVFAFDLVENFITRIFSNVQNISIDFSEIIGNRKQIDFVKDIVQRYNVIYRKNSETEIEFKLVESILQSSDVENWTDKFSEVISEEYTTRYAQSNELKYSYDQDGENFLDGVIELDNELLEPNKTILNSPLKGVRLINGAFIYNYPWGFYDENGQPIENGYYIAYAEKFTDDIFYRINDSDNYTLTNLQAARVTNTDLSFDNFINEYFTAFQQLIERYKKITLNLRLTNIDIYELDFFRPKYFAQLGRKYYLQRVVSYKSDRITKVELLEIPPQT